MRVKACRRVRIGENEKVVTLAILDLDGRVSRAPSLPAPAALAVQAATVRVPAQRYGGWRNHTATANKQEYNAVLTLFVAFRCCVFPTPTFPAPLRF